METHEILALMRKKGIEIDPRDDRSPMQIALDIGIIGLRYTSQEREGALDYEAIQRMKGGGMVVELVDGIYNIYETVPTDEDEV